jgi:hypothetical protein
VVILKLTTMKEYLNITKNPIYITMKTLFFFIPIGCITSKIFIIKYGTYSFTWKLSDLNISHAVFVFFVFATISFIVRWIEIYILPMILIRKGSILKPTESGERFLMKRFGFNVFKKLKELYPDQPLRFELIKELISWPIIICLLLISVNTFVGILVFILFVIVMFLYSKIIMGILDYYDIK